MLPNAMVGKAVKATQPGITDQDRHRYIHEMTELVCRMTPEQRQQMRDVVVVMENAIYQASSRNYRPSGEKK